MAPEAHREAITAFLADTEYLLTASNDDVAAVYDRAADRYDHFRDLWLRLAGADAEAAMLADVRAMLRPGLKVLDAGCGTGALARQIVDLEPSIDLTLIDLSRAMLARTADLSGERLQGSVLDLPLQDESVDLVVSAWVIETVPDPGRAVSEFLRVLKPDGRVLYTFCSLPEGWFSRAGSAWLRHAVRRGFAGRFLEAERTPWHDCDGSHLRRSRHGLTTEVSLQKCCTIAPPVLPFA